MFCCTYDPGLASLLAGTEEATPRTTESLLVFEILTSEILCLLAIGFAL